MFGGPNCGTMVPKLCGAKVEPEPDNGDMLPGLNPPAPKVIPPGDGGVVRPPSIPRKIATAIQFSSRRGFELPGAAGGGGGSYSTWFRATCEPSVGCSPMSA